jgi:hypothetical protein
MEGIRERERNRGTFGFIVRGAAGRHRGSGGVSAGFEEVYECHLGCLLRGAILSGIRILKVYAIKDNF